MSPRPYRLGQRRSASERTRSHVLDATRRVVTAGGGFSIDSVAREAGVTRMTVYYQFGSKVRLLEALFDDLGTRALLPMLPQAVEQPEPVDALRGVVSAFVNFWASERVVLRRIRALSSLDADFEVTVRERDERRRQILLGIVERLRKKHGTRRLPPRDDAVDILQALTSFAMFDALAGEARPARDVSRLVVQVCLDALGLRDE